MAYDVEHKNLLQYKVFFWALKGTAVPDFFCLNIL